MHARWDANFEPDGLTHLQRSALQNDSRHIFSFVCNSSVTETCALDQTNSVTVTLLRHEMAIVVALESKETVTVS
jgi:hypothetical protein